MASLSNYPSSFRGGALIKNLPFFDTIDGNVFWVSSVSGSSGNPGTFNSPIDSIENAMAKCTANNGDIIYCKSGHSEDSASAGAITADVAGVTIAGIGHGSDRAQIRFVTSASADLLVSAVNVRFVNMRFTAAVADVTAAIDIDANDTQFIDCLFDEEEAGENYVVVINVADGVDNVKVVGSEYIGNDASNDHFLEMAGTNENVYVGYSKFSHLTAQTAAAAIIESATQQINMTLEHNYFHSETAAAAASFVVLTGTTNSGWAIGNEISSVDTDATNANALAAFDVSGLHSRGNYFSGGTADTRAVDTFVAAEDLT